MSKERELLKRFMIELTTEQDVVSLFNDIKECLAEPEPTAEPVAWMWANEELGGFYFSNIENPNWKPLYTAPPKREPLSEDNLDVLAVLAEANITDEGIAGYYLGFRDAEKMNGIGGEE